MKMSVALIVCAFLALTATTECEGLAAPKLQPAKISAGSAPPPQQHQRSRRQVLMDSTSWAATVAAVVYGSTTSNPSPANAMEDVDGFLRSGMVSQPMGVSGQAGKSKPETGVVLRDGSEVSRDSRSGDVLAEILVKGNGNLMPIVASFSSPWPLATGTVYDVECRDAQSGDGAFLAVSPEIGGKDLSEVKDAFFVKSLFSPTGRFSFYGQPTDIKVKKSTMSADNKYKIMDVSFSTLSQATQTELPRFAKVVATVPNGSKQAVMLVGSASAARWKKGSEKAVTATIDSFRAVEAPQTGLKVRAQEKPGSLGIQ